MFTDRARKRRPHRKFFCLSLLAGFIVSLICLSAFALIAENVVNNRSFIALDALVAHQLRLLYAPGTARFFRLVTLFGYQLLIIVAAAVGIYFAGTRQWRQLFAWLVVLAGGAFLNVLLKNLLVHPRPLYTEPQVMALYHDFPSGHAIMALSTYGLLAYFLAMIPPHRWQQVFICAALILLILLVGFSRLYLGAHYLSDVLAGFAVGGFWLSLCLTLMNIRPKFLKP